MSSQFNDSDDDDVTLRTRRSPVGTYPEESGRAAEVAEEKAPDREVTLNTGIVLALFFALALLCAVFFGFGYSIGHKSAAVAAEPDTTASQTEAAVAPAAKPAPGVSAGTPVPGYVPSNSAAEKTPSPAAKLDPPVSRPEATTAPREVTIPATAKPTPASRPAPALQAPPPPAATSSPAAPVQAGTSYVQVAAVSHQEDADVLLSALRRRGYTVLTRSDANDKLIHVQIGPFSNRKEADAMRQKLAGDGYNAFIK